MSAYTSFLNRPLTGRQRGMLAALYSRDLHNFVADPPLNIDALSESEVRAELKRRAIDPEASFAAMRELLDDEAAAAELAAARQMRLRRLELIETPSFLLAGLREKIHKALNSLGPQQAAAYFNKFELARDEDLQSLYDDLIALGARVDDGKDDGQS